MDIKEYRYILAIFKGGSISEASRQLYISQPSLSIYLHALEERIGTKLFLKVRGNLQLTDAGKRYIEYAEKIAALDDALGRELQEIKNVTSGEVVLGVTATRGMRLLQVLLPAFKEKYPGITVKIVEGYSANLEDMVRTSKVDIAVLNHSFTQDDLDYTVLSSEEIVVVIPADYDVNKMAQHRKSGELPWIDIAHLGQQPFILLHKEQRMRQIVDGLFQNANIQPPILWELSSATTAFQLSASGLGLSVVTSTYPNVTKDPRVNAYSIGTPPLRTNVVAAYADKSRLSNAALAMLDMIMQSYKLTL